MTSRTADRGSPWRRSHDPGGARGAWRRPRPARDDERAGCLDRSCVHAHRHALDALAARGNICGPVRPPRATGDDARRTIDDRADYGPYGQRIKRRIGVWGVKIRRRECAPPVPREGPRYACSERRPSIQRGDASFQGPAPAAQNRICRREPQGHDAVALGGVHRPDGGIRVHDFDLPARASPRARPRRPLDAPGERTALGATSATFIRSPGRRPGPRANQRRGPLECDCPVVREPIADSVEVAAAREAVLLVARNLMDAETGLRNRTLIEGLDFEAVAVDAHVRQAGVQKALKP